jgi:hypothetical protein
MTGCPERATLVRQLASWRPIALAWCFEDEQTDPVMALLDRVTETGATAPQLWPIEALNGLLAAEHRGRIDEGASNPDWLSAGAADRHR